MGNVSRRSPRERRIVPDTNSTRENCNLLSFRIMNVGTFFFFALELSLVSSRGGAPGGIVFSQQLAGSLNLILSKCLFTLIVEV